LLNERSLLSNSPDDSHSASNACLCNRSSNNRSFWDLVHPSDHAQLRVLLSDLVLTKNGRAKLRCGIRTSFADYFLPLDVTLKHGSLGIVCSLWVPPEKSA
jgi:hypothetical protein